MTKAEEESHDNRGDETDQKGKGIFLRADCTDEQDPSGNRAEGFQRGDGLPPMIR